MKLSASRLWALTPLLLCAAASPTPKPPKYDPGIEVGQDAHGLRFPVYDEAGNLQMYFVIEIAKRIDNDHMEMSKVELQTFDEKKTMGMKIDMQNAVLDLNTRIVTTDKHVFIKRSDFELSGDKAVYNTATGDGKVIGKVRMLIYDSAVALGGKAGQ